MESAINEALRTYEQEEKAGAGSPLSGSALYWNDLKIRMSTMVLDIVHEVMRSVAWRPIGTTRRSAQGATCATCIPPRS